MFGNDFLYGNLLWKGRNLSKNKDNIDFTLLIGLKNSILQYGKEETNFKYSNFTVAGFPNKRISKPVKFWLKKKENIYIINVNIWLTQEFNYI